MKSKVFCGLRIGIMVFSLLAFFWFLICYCNQIKNIGTYFGLFLCALIFVGAAFSPRLWQNFFRHPKHLWMKGAAGTVAAVFLLCAGYAFTLTGFMIGAASQAPVEGSTVVVLGCKVNGKEPSLMLQRRLQAAEKYLKAHPDAVAILSGGRGENEEISEAQCMFTYLTKAGIQKKRLLLEECSTSTEENLAFSADIIHRWGLSKNVAIVTDGFHELRASIFAEREGLLPSAVPASTPWFVFPAYYMRELFGLSYQMIS